MASLSKTAPSPAKQEDLVPTVELHMHRTLDVGRKRTWVAVTITIGDVAKNGISA